MVTTVIVLLIILTICILIGLSPLLARRRRNRLKTQPFPRHWVGVIEQNIPFYQRLPTSWQKRLQGLIQIFLAEKQFIGCGGLQVTEDMKLTIAAQACLLLLNERGEYYPKLRSILVYPSAYRVKTTQPIGNYVVEERNEVRLGESWATDRVVLSWEQVNYDTRNWQDGRNVVLHEFAHQLDIEDGVADGVPILHKKSDYLTWASVFAQDYQKLRSDVERGLNTVIDEYGAIEPAEFFAVATETFFEKPQQLATRHSALYQELKRYYKLDPRLWI